MIATGSLIDGHGLLSDWLFLVAAVLFLIAVVLTRRPSIVAAAEAAYAGLCVAAVAFLVL